MNARFTAVCPRLMPFLRRRFRVAARNDYATGGHFVACTAAALPAPPEGFSRLQNLKTVCFSIGEC